MTEEFKQKSLAKYKELLAKHHSEPDNQKLIRDDYYEWAKDNMPAETIEALRTVARQNVWQWLEHMAKGNNAYLVPLTEGQLHMFEVDDVVDSPIVAGKRRRVLAGDMTKDDSAAILRERQENAARVTAALLREEASAAVRALWIDEHGSVRKAHAAGEIPGLAEDDEADS